MIPALLYLSPLAFIAWLVALPAVWRGQPRVALWAAGAAFALGLVVSIGAVALPRYSDFWLGNMGAGDGFGLIGLVIFGAGVAAVAAVLFVVTVIVAAMRRKKSSGEALE